jgi:serine/threonine-protein kinase
MTSTPTATKSVPEILGRYALYAPIARGGMATVHLGRLTGVAGFTRMVAIKRLHSQFAQDPEFVSMFLDEARLAARIRHPNVVQVIDVVALDGELFLVMDYVHGESLAKLIRRSDKKKTAISPRIAVGIIAGVLHGLHAAHQAKSERGQDLNIVHRDVSPQNIIVGMDGVPRILDFGIAKASNRVATTRQGLLKGKLSYMAPEQLHLKGADRRTDVYAASVVLWEMLSGKQLFPVDEPAATLLRILNETIPPITTLNPSVPRPLEAILQQGLAKNPEERFKTARELALALERAVVPPSNSQVSEWVETTAGKELRNRAVLVAEIESASADVCRLNQSSTLQFDGDEPGVVSDPSNPSVQTGEPFVDAEMAYDARPQDAPGDAPPEPDSATGTGSEAADPVVEPASQTSRFPRGPTLVLATAILLAIPLTWFARGWADGRSATDPGASEAMGPASGLGATALQSEAGAPTPVGADPAADAGKVVGAAGSSASADSGAPTGSVVPPPPAVSPKPAPTRRAPKGADTAPTTPTSGRAGFDTLKRE